MMKRTVRDESAVLSFGMTTELVEDAVYFLHFLIDKQKKMHRIITVCCVAVIILFCYNLSVVHGEGLLTMIRFVAPVVIGGTCMLFRLECYLRKNHRILECISTGEYDLGVYYNRKGEKEARITVQKKPNSRGLYSLAIGKVDL